MNAQSADFRLETFLPGEENVLAVEAVHKVLDEPGDRHNPLFLFGPPSVGKTHLLYALRTKFEQARPNWNILCLPAGEFIEECDSARRNQSTYEFRQQIWRLDLLMIDDVHLLQDRPAAQEEVYHAFNRFLADGRQLVFTSREAPADLPSFPTALRMRFQCGLVVPIDPPRERMMRDLIEQNAHLAGLKPTQKAASYLCREVRNIRELRGVFHELRQSVSANGAAAAVSLEEVRAVVKRRASAKLSIADVAKVVCDYMHVDANRVRSASRRQSLVQARQLAMFLVRELTGAPLTEIGRYFGGRDHTTVLYACRKIADDVRKNNFMARAARDVKALLKG